MRTAILQYKFDQSVSDFMIEDDEFNHAKIGYFIHENLPDAQLIHAGFYYGDIDHPTEDETSTSDLYIDIVIDFENPDLIEDFKSKEQDILEYVVDIFEPEMVVVHQYFKVGNDEYFIVAHGDAVDNLFEQ